MRLYKYDYFDDVLSISLNEEKAPYIYSNSNIIDYTDITSIINLYNFGYITGKDFKFVRDLIKIEVENIAVSTCLGIENDDRNIISPNIGDRYLIGNGGIKGFRYKSNKIAEWDGSVWVFKSLEQVGFDECNSEEQNILLINKIGTHEQRLSRAVDMNDLINKGLLYHSKMIGLDFAAVRPSRLAILVAMTHNYTEHLFIEMNQTLTSIDDNSNLSIYNTPPISPNVGDKVIVGNNGNGVFDGKEKDVAEWNGVSWDFKSRVFLSLPEFIFGIIKTPQNDYLNTYMMGVVGKPVSLYGDRIDGIANFIDCNIDSKWHISKGNIGLRNFGYIMSALPEGLSSWSELADIMLNVLIYGIYEI